MELGQEPALKDGHSFVLKVSLKRKGSSVYKGQWEVASGRWHLYLRDGDRRDT